MSSSEQSLARLPEGAETPSYLQRVIQHGFSTGQVTEQDVRRWERKLLSLSDRLALRESRHTAPTNEEIRGARLLATAWITNALEHDHGTNLASSLQALQQTPFQKLYRHGIELRQELRRSLREQAKMVKTRGQRFTLDEVLTIEMVDQLFEVNLETVALAADSNSSYEKRDYYGLVQALFNFRTMMEVGIMLEDQFRTFFRQNPFCRYSEAVGNLAVQIAAGQTPTITVSFEEIREFLRLQRSDEEWRQLGHKLGQQLQAYGLPLPGVYWFVQHLWPKLVKTYLLLAEREVTIELCRLNSAFFSNEQRGRKAFVNEENIPLAEWDLLVHDFLKRSIKGKISLLQELEPETGNNLLEIYEEVTSSPNVAKLFAQLPRENQIRMLFFKGLTSDDIYADGTSFAATWIQKFLRTISKSPDADVFLMAFVKFEEHLHHDPGFSS